MKPTAMLDHKRPEPQVTAMKRKAISQILRAGTNLDASGRQRVNQMWLAGNYDAAMDAILENVKKGTLWS